MAGPTFPQFLYNKDGACMVCDNLIAVNVAKEKGYRVGYVPVYYPKVVYSPEGLTASVSNEVELKLKIEAGWTEEFVAVPPEKPKVTVLGVSADAATIQALFAEIGDLKRRIDALEAPGPAPVQQKVIVNNKPVPAAVKAE